MQLDTHVRRLLADDHAESLRRSMSQARRDDRVETTGDRWRVPERQACAAEAPVSAR